MRKKATLIQLNGKEMLPNSTKLSAHGLDISLFFIHNYQDIT